MLIRFTSLIIALSLGSFATATTAQETITIGPQALKGVPIGSDANVAIPKLKMIFGRGNDSGWIDGCEFNGIKERYVTWGGLTASFEETEYFGNVFVAWSYALNTETNRAKRGGPTVDQIELPMGVHVGDRFSDVAQIYGFEPTLDDVFGIGIYRARYFEMITASEDLNGPIVEVAVPHFYYCE